MQSKQEVMGTQLNFRILKCGSDSVMESVTFLCRMKRGNEQRTRMSYLRFSLSFGEEFEQQSSKV